MMNVHGLRIIVIGLGISGKSASSYLLSQKASVIGVDRNRELLKTDACLENLRKLGLVTKVDSEMINLKNIDLVVVSPGISPNHPLILDAKKVGIECVGEVELACRAIVSPCIGITGTNGKTTVTLLVAHVLNHTGRAAQALGNVGKPFTSFEPDKIIVAELSSFQLETMHAKVLDIAVVLNITADHLDRYTSMEEYAKAKMQIVNCLKPEGKFFIEELAYKKYGRGNCLGHLTHVKAEVYGSDPKSDIFLTQNSIRYRGEAILEGLQAIGHDRENLVAAYAICKEFGVTSSEFLKAVSSFRKPPHRVEFIKEYNNVCYYDDSKGTNIDAVIKAVCSLFTKSGKIILIAGGVHKGSSYSPWIEPFKSRVSLVFAIGEAATKIRTDLNGHILVEVVDSLDVAVRCAIKNAQHGDIVLLSPGCSSYDMFKDYKDRGKKFQSLVHNLLK